MKALTVIESFDWRGQEVLDAALDEIDARLDLAGKAWLRAAQSFVPIRTGKLHDSLTYRVVNHELFVEAWMYYASFVEFGTRRMGPRPYIRPALNVIGSILTGRVTMELGLRAGGKYEGIARAAVGPRKGRLRAKLIHKSRHLHTGNARKARLRFKTWGGS